MQPPDPCVHQEAHVGEKPYGCHLCPKKFPKRSDLSRTEPFVVSEINGSFMLFPADVFWQIGGFDTNIFLFHEEYDIGRRIELYGYQNVVFPTAKFLHAHGATTQASPRCIRQERFISKIYCYSKWHNPFMSGLFRAENIPISRSGENSL